ncbi:A disintegrin and metalloproteinase with thrombospondin motifs adt-1-like [Tetranychus urticae]|uniref:A disintegrin and metalloproteinase with thrombospondin motifs adt-1-like n=1 Tax=Tetranychus urticae TaxID=32264 RepID=UPI000D652D88|nr:A disintegrin and metalloproteinase with thrombospondin motifs adt-1-like [Tetranychus urticae]
MNEEDRKKAFQEYLMINETSNEINRPKRSLAKIYTIETAIFVDSSLAQKYDGHLDDLQRLIMSIMNEVQLIYEYSSMETRIQIVITKLEILRNEGPDDAEGDIDQYLDNFCLWQAKLHRAENWAQRWDHALMLTGLDLYKDIGGGKKNKKVLGLAWVNGMCKPTYSCTLNEGKSFEASFVIAHEMGHSLGILHDGRSNNCDADKFIMSEKTGPGKINWSPCSNVYITNFLSRGHGRCLENVAMATGELDFRRLGRLPGEQFPPNIQCQLALGSQYKAYVSSKEPFNNICRELWCLSGSWATPAHPALEGSQCGPDDRRCYQGSCSSGRVKIQEAQESNINNHFNRLTSLSQSTSFNGGQLIPLNRPSSTPWNRRWNRNRTGFRPFRRKSSINPFYSLPNPGPIIYNRRRPLIDSNHASQLDSLAGMAKSSQSSETIRMKRKTDSDDKQTMRSSKGSINGNQSKQSTNFTNPGNFTNSQTAMLTDNLWMETIRNQIKSFTEGAKNLFSSLFRG